MPTRRSGSTLVLRRLVLPDLVPSQSPLITLWCFDPSHPLYEILRQVIVTSHLFPSAKFDEDRLRRLSESVGKGRLVVDVSCRKRGDKWVVAMNRWQDLTDMEVNEGE